MSTLGFLVFRRFTLCTNCGSIVVILVALIQVSLGYPSFECSKTKAKAGKELSYNNPSYFRILICSFHDLLEDRCTFDVTISFYANKV